MLGVANASTVATYTVCGMLSGILSRYGKIGAIIGFILGNAVWVFYTNASTEIIIPIGEIVIASVVLLFLPKRVGIFIDNMFDYDNTITGKNPIALLAESTIYKLKSASDVAKDMASNVEKEGISLQDERGTFIRNVKENTCANCQNYQQCWEKNYHTMYETVFNSFEVLQEKNEVEEREIEESICTNKTVLVNGLNNAYSLYQLNTEWKSKVQEDKVLMAKQLRGVSQVIDKVQDDIWIAADEVPSIGNGLKLSFAKACTTKNENEISGDTIKYITLKTGKTLIALSDGMGTGKVAARGSRKILELVERYFNAGLEKKVVMELVNSYMMVGENSENYATLDAILFDNNTGNAEIIKLGACPTYLWKDNQVKLISSHSLPVGALAESSAETFHIKLERNTMLVMLSDGVIEANPQKEKWVVQVLKSLKTKEVQKVADRILQEAMDENLGIAKDDMSVVVVKVC